MSIIQEALKELRNMQEDFIDNTFENKNVENINDFINLAKKHKKDIHVNYGENFYAIGQGELKYFINDLEDSEYDLGPITFNLWFDEAGYEYSTNSINEIKQILKEVLDYDLSLPSTENYNKFISFKAQANPSDELKKLFELIWNKVSPEYKIVFTEDYLHAYWDFAYGDGMIYLLPEADWNEYFLENNGVNPMTDPNDKDEQFFTDLEDDYNFVCFGEESGGITIASYKNSKGEVDTYSDQDERFLQINGEEGEDEDYELKPFSIEEAADIITELLLK